MSIRKSGFCVVLALSLMAIGGAWLKAQDFRFSQLSRTNREPFVNLTTPSNGPYTILVSTNTVEWSALVTALSTNGSIQYTDSAAPYLLNRYYRGLQLTNPSVVTGDHIPTGAGDVVIHKGYHASFAMNWNNLMIYVDPTNTFPELPRADLILLTHDHGDHYNTNAIHRVKGPNTILVVPQRIYSLANFSPLTSISIVLSNGYSTNLLGINIEAIPMYNFGTSPPHVKGVGNGYVLTLGGKRFYLSGDTQDIPEMLALTNIDVAFLAMNQPYTMTVAQAVNAVRGFVPKIVYPNHYRGNPVTDLASFKQQVMTNPAVEVRLRNWY